MQDCVIARNISAANPYKRLLAKYLLFQASGEIGKQISRSC